MTKKLIRYYINWDNTESSIAKVRMCPEDATDPDFYKTFGEAKRALLEDAAQRAKDWRDKVKYLRSLKRAHISEWGLSEIYNNEGHG